jgi:hypothetical protein
MADVCQTTALNDKAQENSRYQANRADKCSQEAMQLLSQQSKMGSFKSPDSSKVSSLELGSSSDLSKLYGGSQSGDRKLNATKPGDAKPGDAQHAAAHHGDAKAGGRSDSHNQKHDQSPKKQIAESTHPVKAGETLEGLAKQKLGPNAKREDIDKYVSVMKGLNGIEEEKKLAVGTTLDMPGRSADGTLHGQNLAHEQYQLHPDGKEEWRSEDGSRINTRTPVGKDGSYDEEHKGTKPEDNYHVHYDKAKDETTSTFQDGTKVVTDKAGVQTTTSSDGSTVTTYPDAQGGRTERSIPNKGAQDPSGDRTVTTTWKNGGVNVKNEGDGSGYARTPDGKGGYTEHGWGKKPEQNYDEKYNKDDGSTTRTDATGTKTTQWSDGTKKVEHADKTGYQTRTDGSEHHFGPKAKDNFDKPAEDLSNNKHVADARKAMDDALDHHEPKLSDKEKKDFHDKETAFENRAKAEHMSAEEVAKTYEQVTKLLSAKNGKVSDPNLRAQLAEEIMTHAAKPETVKQGEHQTCNVTTVAERTYSRNPSKMAEMVTTTALTGEWKAADGKVIKIDSNSLKPGREESEARYDPEHPKDPDHRSFANQIANNVMVNDATQRRNPPEYYSQGPTDGPGDTGERLFNKPEGDPQRKALTQNVVENGVTKAALIKEPTLSDSEIAQVGQRLTGDKGFYLDARAPGEGDGTNHYENKQQFEDALKQMKDKHQFPAVVGVDQQAAPFGNGSSGGNEDHVVNVTAYDEQNHRVLVHDPADSGNDRWMTVDELYKNLYPDQAANKVANVEEQKVAA